ncbi:MAG TPA: cellulase family glycosylhydrolase [Abditibacteriaceae bacterium]|nr:cellulase family glycosylhydrolase [Abditibacteriaceae bacterium]
MLIAPSAIRGFNYQPSYSAHLQYTWTHFDRACWEREVPFALRFGSNVLRVWLDWSAYLAIGSKMLDAVEAALQVLDQNGLRMMPVLFNRWTDPQYPAGGVSTEELSSPLENFAAFLPYVDALMERCGDDERIALWDLCNEPQAPHGVVAERETAWLRRINERVREKTKIPITIGTMTGDNVRHYADLVDVISFHPYTRELGAMQQLCEDHLKMARESGKPLLCTETCCGSLDDFERGALARDNIETLEEYGIGWLAWQLSSGLFVTGSRERTDSNAVRPGEGYMPFVLPDGSTRPGHAWLERA